MTATKHRIVTVLAPAWTPGTGARPRARRFRVFRPAGAGWPLYVDRDTHAAALEYVRDDLTRHPAPIGAPRA